MIDFIYALVDKDLNKFFYIGRTINPYRRLMEHRLGAKHYKDGDEWKYQYANALDAAGIEWDMEVLMECGPGTEFYEDYFINLHRDHPLQNMRAGDDEPWMGRDYSGPDEFVKTRAAELEKQKIKIVKPKKDNFDADKMLWSFEKADQKFMSPAVREFLAKRGRLK